MCITVTVGCFVAVYDSMLMQLWKFWTPLLPFFRWLFLIRFPGTQTTASTICLSCFVCMAPSIQALLPFFPSACQWSEPLTPETSGLLSSEDWAYVYALCHNCLYFSTLPFIPNLLLVDLQYVTLHWFWSRGAKFMEVECSLFNHR